MKNKHLVYLFLTILAAGFLLRWLPVQYRSLFHANLIELEPTLVQRIVIEVPNKPVLEINLVKGTWIGAQSSKTAVISSDTVFAMLNIMAKLEFFQTVKSKLPDTLGLHPAQVIRLAFAHLGGKTEVVELGNHGIWKNKPISYIRLPGHSGIYMVPGHLRTAFLRKLDDFRSSKIADFDPAAIRKIGVQRVGKLPIYLSGPDSLQRWIFSNNIESISNDSVFYWLSLFKRLQGSPFADYFDESLANETLHTKLFLGLESGQFLTFRIFHVIPPNIPEDLSRARNTAFKPLPAYVLHSSQNPSNFFAIPDSNLALILVNGLLINAE